MNLLAHRVVAPFSHVSLCLNCDWISDAVGDICPHCGYRGLMNLKKAFNALGHRHVFDSDHGLVRDQRAAYLRCRCGERMQISLEER
jgi:hypothetical protein